MFDFYFRDKFFCVGALQVRLHHANFGRAHITPPRGVNYCSLRIGIGVSQSLKTLRADGFMGHRGIVRVCCSACDYETLSVMPSKLPPPWPKLRVIPNGIERGQGDLGHANGLGTVVGGRQATIFNGFGKAIEWRTPHTHTVELRRRGDCGAPGPAAQMAPVTRREHGPYR